MPEEIHGGAGGAGGVGNLFAGTNITISTSGNSATIIGGVNTGATTFIAGMTGTNTAGTAGTVNNQMLFAGGNNVTLSQSINAGSATISFIGRNPQTGISGVSASDTVYTSGTVKWTGSNMVTVKSGAGQAVVIDATQSVQPEGTVAFGVSSGGNTLGTTGLATGTGPRLVFVGGTNITLSQSLDAGGSSGTITIVGPDPGTGGVFSGGVSSGGNTVGTTGLVSNQLLLVGGNNVTLSQSSGVGGATVTISGANIGGAQTGISGISASDTVYTSGTVKLTGSNMVTVKSGTGQAVIIDATQSVQPEGTVSFGVSSGGNTAGSTGMATGTGPRLVLYGGANITLSQSLDAGSNSATVSIIGASGGTGAGYTAGLSTGGNTAGDATNVTGRLIFAGGNNITLSGSTNAGSMTITISAPSGGGAGVSTGGNTAGTTGTVDYQLIFVGGSNISLSQSINGSSGTITINGATAGGGGFQSAGISTQGNTSGTTGFASSQILFVGGNNITLSQSINAGNVTLTISGANAGGAQTGISGIVASDATYTSGTVVFTGSNNITVVSGTGQRVIISGPTGGGAGMSTQGNTAGTTGTVGKELIFVGGSNISLSQSVNGQSATLTINAATAGGGQTAISGISASDTVYTSGTVKFTGSNIITVKSGTGQAVIIDATVAAQTVESQSLGMSNLGNTSGTTGIASGGQVQFLFAGGNNITLSQSLNGASGTITVSAASQTVQAEGTQTLGMSNLGNTAGTTGVATGTGVQFIFVGSNNITASQSINGASGTITFLGVTSASLVPADVIYSVSSTNASGTQHSWFARGDHSHAGVGPAGVSTGGNTIGSTAVLHGQLVFAGGNNVTLSQSTDASNRMTITVSAASQSVQTQGSVQINGSTGAISFDAGNNMSLSTVASNLTFINVLSSSAIAQPVSNVSSAGTLSSRFALADHAHVGVAGLNVSGTASTWVGNVMLSVTNLTLVTGGNSSAGSIGISAAAPGGGGMAFGMTNTGNTSGTTFSSSSGTMYFQGTNNITVSNSSAAGIQTLWFSGPTGGGAGMGTGGNTSGTSGTVGKELYLYAGNNITLSQSRDGASLSASLTISAGGVTLSSYEMLSAYASTVLSGVPTATSAVVSIAPFTVGNYISAGAMNILASMNFLTVGTSSGRQTAGFHVGLYSRGIGANSTRLESLKTNAIEWSITGNNSSYSVNQITATSYSGFGATAQTNSAGVNITSGYTGMKLFAIPVNLLITPGAYWIAILATNSTSSVNVGISMSTLGVAIDTKQTAVAPMGSFTVSNSLNPDPFARYHVGLGSWSSAGSVTKLPDVMAFTSISGANTQVPLLKLWST